MIKFILTFSALLLSAVTSQAMYAAIYQETSMQLDTQRPTHFLVASEGQELGNLPHEAALTQALYIKRQNPSDQIVILSNFDLKNQGLDQLQKWNLNLVMYPRNPNVAYSYLTVVSVIEYMNQFNQIKSFHLFGHSNIPYGAKLFLGFRFGFNDEQFPYIAKIKANFTSDAYAVLHGCNSGWKLAVKLSEIWGIPVSGSFTGTIFERMTSSSRFFEEGNKKVSYAKSNFNIPCDQGACIRQVPQNVIYHGHYGSYFNPSLNFFKFFCRSQTSDKCFLGMAKSVINSVNNYSNVTYLNLENYKNRVADILCRNDQTRQACFNFLKELSSEKTSKLPDFRKSFFMNTKYGQLNASFDGHWAIPECVPTEGKSDPTCKINVYGDSSNSETLANEYEGYLKGFELYQKIKKAE